MEKSRLKSLFLVVTILVLLLNLGVFLFSLNNAGIFEFNTNVIKAEASVSFCIDPLATLTNISTTCGSDYYLHTNETYNCILQYNQTDNDTILFWSYFSTQPELFEIEQDGFFNYTATHNTWGNHTAIIILEEIFGYCPVNDQATYYTYDFTVRFNNTPPEYYKIIPNVSMPRNSMKIPYYLSDYFRDIDLQDLSYSYLTSSYSAYFDITVNKTTGETIIESKTDCGTYPLTFFAEDPYPYEAYATSSPSPNLIISCGHGPHSGGSGSGGSSRGGGSGTSIECDEDWKCQDWSDCYAPREDMTEYPKGYRKRDCYDQNGCDPNNYRVTRYEECDYANQPSCYPEWKCTEWTPCQKDGIKRRTCNDINSCSLENQKRFGIPETEQLCVYPETCLDGLKNGNELGIDCGGSCEPCKTIELASTINDSNKILTWAIAILVGLFVILSVLYWIFKKDIKIILSKIMWSIVKKTSRQIYLLGEHKKKILSDLKKYEKLLQTTINKDSSVKQLDSLESELYILFRKVISQITNTNMDSSREEIINKINKLDTTNEFRKMILSISEKLLRDEKQGKNIILSRTDDIIADYNIIKFLVFNISDNITEEYKDINLKIQKQNTNIYTLCKILNDTYIELQKGNIKLAKNNYLGMIRIYESMNEEEKTLVYELTIIIFNILTYLSSHIE